MNGSCRYQLQYAKKGSRTANNLGSSRTFSVHLLYRKVQCNCKIYPFLKRQCHKICWHFFSSIQPIWVPDKQSKMVLLKNSFSRRFAKNVTLRSVILRRVGKLKCPKIPNCLTLRWVGLRAVRYCAQSDSAQCDTAPSRTPAVWYCDESNNLFWFSKTSISVTFRMWWYFAKKISKIFWKSKNG